MSRVYVNRTLNLRKIHYLGFDMDHTLVRYDSRAFEAFTHRMVIERLVKEKNYPRQLLDLDFNYEHAIRGLVLDKQNGNLLKLSRHGAIRASQHGLKTIPYGEQKKIYGSKYIDLGSENFSFVDTAFSVSTAILFAQLIELKDNGLPLPDYLTMANEMMLMVDTVHRDGSLKAEVAKDLPKFILRSKTLVTSLERYRKHGKQLFILTNSDFAYTKMLLDYAIQPFLQEHKHWTELFEFVVTGTKKPRFFYEHKSFVKIDLNSGQGVEWKQKLVPGIYQGGCASQFTRDLDLNGEDILYIGDHIYGDILRLKKDCNWRTALVVEEIKEEVRSTHESKDINFKIETLMAEKMPIEMELVALQSAKIENPETLSSSHESRIDLLQDLIQEIDKKIAPLIQQQQSAFNAKWGEMMRTGNEDSYFAYQVDRFACVYMSELEDLLSLSPRTYFRPQRRLQPHERED